VVRKLTINKIHLKNYNDAFNNNFLGYLCKIVNILNLRKNFSNLGNCNRILDYDYIFKCSIS